MTEKRFRVFKFPDVDKFGVSDDIAEVTVAFCDKKWEADSLCDLLNELSDENEQLKSFVKELSNDCGEIVLMNGSAYNVKKAVGDFE